MCRQSFLLYPAELFSVVENKLYGCADFSTLAAVVRSPGEIVAVTETPDCNLNRVSMLCDQCGMKFNASKTKTMIVSRSRTIHTQSTPLTLDGTVLKKTANLVILGMTLDTKMTFGKPFGLFPELQLRGLVS